MYTILCVLRVFAFLFSTQYARFYEGGIDMGQGIVFLNSFLSYLLLMIIIVCVAALGFIVGRILRKRKDGKTVNAESIESVTESSPGSADNS